MAKMQKDSSKQDKMESGGEGLLFALTPVLGWVSIGSRSTFDTIHPIGMMFVHIISFFILSNK